MKLTDDPDYETQSSYSFTITASDAAGTSVEQAVSFNITNVDESVPTITSGSAGTNLVENSGAGQVIYTVVASSNDPDEQTLTYALGGTDSGKLTLDGEDVKLTADPDHETQSSYSFTITASDAAGTSAAETVSFNITNVDEAKPTISSGATGTDLVENSGAGQVIYTIAASANDGGAISGYELGGTDGALLSLDGTNVKLTADPDYETKHSYSFTVTASDATATSDAKTVQFSINNVDETAPTITSGDTGTTLAENSGAGQTVYTITADANDDGTIASYAIAGTDADKLDVVASTGVVTLTADPDYETQSSYSFTVTATDATATSNATTVQFSITNVDDIDPTITSAATGTNLVENSGAGQIVYTIVASANDGGTIASYAIGGTDKDLLTLDGTSVKLTANPDYETKNGYSFWVTATDATGTSVEKQSPSL